MKVNRMQYDILLSTCEYLDKTKNTGSTLTLNGLIYAIISNTSSQTDRVVFAYECTKRGLAFAQNKDVSEVLKSDIVNKIAEAYKLDHSNYAILATLSNKEYNTAKTIINGERVKLFNKLPKELRSQKAYNENMPDPSFTEQDLSIIETILAIDNKIKGIVKK